MYATRMSLTVENLTHGYSKRNYVFEDLSFHVGEGEIVAIVGQSGCGKSTLLHCIAGLITPSSGSIHIAGESITHKKPHERGIGIMMQDQPLYEHLSVEQNIAFPLQARGEKKTSILQLLDQLKLTKVSKQKVSTCSGGERRRVAFGRAIVLEPKVLLLDEPFVSLDKELKTLLEDRIRISKITTLLVSHNEVELEYDRSIQLETYGAI